MHFACTCILPFSSVLTICGKTGYKYNNAESLDKVQVDAARISTTLRLNSSKSCLYVCFQHKLL